MQLIVHTLLSAVLLMVAGRVVKGIEVRDLKAAVIGTLVFGFANWLIWAALGGLGPVLLLLTLWFFALVVNAVALMVTGALVRGLTVESFPAALMGAVVLGLMNLLLGVLFRIF
ncbi:MAG: phage holin family protein [Gemmatimonadota bacterium]|nr:phage holin family protein [Gemmatimonadota bacterium]